MQPYYEQDGISIYHCDSRDVLVPWWTMADVLVTDPPYGIAWKRSLNKRRNSPAHSGIAGDADTSVRDAVLNLWGAKRPAVVFGSFYAKYPTPTRQILVWHKPVDAGVVGSVTGYRRDAEPIFLVGAWPLRLVEASSVLSSTAHSIAQLTAETGHPHTKPVDLLMRLIQMSPAGAIVDPFMGSGSTLIAAKRLGRKAIGCEIDKEYCEVAARRLQQGLLSLELGA